MNPFNNARIPFPVMVDAYQATMTPQIPAGMENFQCSQLTNRGNSIAPNCQKVVQAGLTLFSKWLDELTITQEDIDKADEFYSTFRASIKGQPFPWPKEMFQTIVDKYNGKLPIVVTGLPDGTTHYIGEPCVQVWTDEPGMGELVGYIESELVPYMWQSSVVATRGRIIKEQFMEVYRNVYPSLTDDELKAMIAPKFHDFGRRGGANSFITGIAHLMNWGGTDTCDSAYYAQNELNGGDSIGACSIPAMAHRTVTPWSSETEAYDNMIEQFGDDIVAIVADSYEFHNGAKYLASQVEKLREKGGVLVVRPDCYSDDTEILTDKGWELFKNITLDTKVAQYHEDKTIDFVNPLKYVNEHYSGDMIHFTNKIGRTDLLVTPNHRMVKRKRDTEEIIIQEASDVKYYYDFIHEVSGFLNNNSEPLTPYERLLIAFQADGSYESGELNRKAKINDYYTIRFNFTKKRKVKRLIKILTEGQFNFKVSYEKSRPRNTQIYVQVKKFPSKIFDWVDIKNINSEWCKQFVEELSYWDSTRREEYRFKYSSKEKFNTDIVQTICCLGGIKTKYTKEIDTRSDLHSDIHTLHILTNETGIDSQSISKKTVKYDGKIYCVQVPSGMIIVRRNNCVSISGNSGDPVECVVYGLNELAKTFGTTEQESGLKVINGAAVIQADGITMEDIFFRILPAVIDDGFCPSNVAFGCGQGNHKAMRSDLETAYKTCCVENSENGFVVKDCAVMKGSNSQFKRSFPCPVCVSSDSTYRVNPITRNDLEEGRTGELEVYYDGRPNPLPVREFSLNEFNEIQKRTYDTWNELDKTPITNSISPQIIQLQDNYMVDVENKIQETLKQLS